MSDTSAINRELHRFDLGDFDTDPTQRLVCKKSTFEIFSKNKSIFDFFRRDYVTDFKKIIESCAEKGYVASGLTQKIIEYNAAHPKNQIKPETLKTIEQFEQAVCGGVSRESTVEKANRAIKEEELQDTKNHVVLVKNDLGTEQLWYKKVSFWDRIRYTTGLEKIAEFCQRAGSFPQGLKERIATYNDNKPADKKIKISIPDARTASLSQVAIEALTKSQKLHVSAPLPASQAEKSAEEPVVSVEKPEVQVVKQEPVQLLKNAKTSAAMKTALETLIELDAFTDQAIKDEMSEIIGNAETTIEMRDLLKKYEVLFLLMDCDEPDTLREAIKKAREYNVLDDHQIQSELHVIFEEAEVDKNFDLLKVLQAEKITNSKKQTPIASALSRIDTAALKALTNPAQLHNMFVQLVEKQKEKNLDPAEKNLLQGLCKQLTSPLNLTDLHKTLIAYPFPEEIIDMLIQAAEEERVKVKASEASEPYKTFGEVVACYKELVTQGASKNAFPERVDAFRTAFIMKYEMPKIQNIFATEGYVEREDITGKGWKLLKEKEHIYVITSHEVAEGSSKFVHSAFEFAIHPQAVQPARLMVHLTVTDEEAEIEHEKNMNLLIKSKNLQSCLTLTSARDLSTDGNFQVGFIAEPCEGDFSDILLDQNFTMQPQDVLKRLELFREAFEGVAELHALGIVHLDLKPENFFIVYDKDGKPHLKIGDFGTANPFKAKQVPQNLPGCIISASSYSTPSYTAPVLRNTKLKDGAVQAIKEGTINLFQADIWAMIMILKESYDNTWFSWIKLFEKRVTFLNDMAERIKDEIDNPVSDIRQKSEKEPLTQDEKIKLEVYTLIQKLLKLQEKEIEGSVAQEALQEINQSMKAITALAAS